MDNSFGPDVVPQFRFLSNARVSRRREPLVLRRQSDNGDGAFFLPINPKKRCRRVALPPQYKIPSASASSPLSNHTPVRQSQRNSAFR